MVSCTTKFTAESKYDLLSTVIFPGFIYSCNMSYKINKTIMVATKLIYTGNYTRVMDFKFLPEPKDRLNILQKKYQALSIPDKLIMHLILHELAY